MFGDAVNVVTVLQIFLPKVPVCDVEGLGERAVSDAPVQPMRITVENVRSVLVLLLDAPPKYPQSLRCSQRGHEKACIEEVRFVKLKMYEQTSRNIYG